MTVRSVLTVFVLLLSAGSALGFGAKGHRIIGEIAEQQLTETAYSAVETILKGESLAFASTWADEMRSSPDNPEFWGYDYSANWHFVNIGRNLSYADSDISRLGDAYVALDTFSAILRGQPIPGGPVKEGLEFYFGNLNAPALQPRLRQFALRFLIHIVEDLHQPLHSGFSEDQGGNLVRVKWFGSNTNLHTVWDTSLVEFPGLSYSEYSMKISEQLTTMPAAEIREIQEAEPMQWIEEALVMREDAYAVERYNSDFGYPYTFAFVPLLERQMLKGGLRLAALLNDIFD